MFLKFLVCFILGYAVFRLYVEKSNIKLKGEWFKKKNLLSQCKVYTGEKKKTKKNRVLGQILEVPTARPNPEGKPKLFTVNF